jgi:hypothetical protein
MASLEFRCLLLHTLTQPTLDQCTNNRHCGWKRHRYTWRWLGTATRVLLQLCLGMGLVAGVHKRLQGPPMTIRIEPFTSRATYDNPTMQNRTPLALQAVEFVITPPPNSYIPTFEKAKWPEREQNLQIQILSHPQPPSQFFNSNTAEAFIAIVLVYPIPWRAGRVERNPNKSNSQKAAFWTPLLLDSWLVLMRVRRRGSWSS